MCIICNILCCAIAISNFDSETCNTPPKRLWKDRAGKKCQDLRQYTLKVPCICTKPGAAFKSKAPGDSQGSPNHTTTTTTSTKQCIIRNHNLSALKYGLSPGT